MIYTRCKYFTVNITCQRVCNVSQQDLKQRTSVNSFCYSSEFYSAKGIGCAQSVRVANDKRAHSTLAFSFYKFCLHHPCLLPPSLPLCNWANRGKGCVLFHLRFSLCGPGPWITFCSIFTGFPFHNVLATAILDSFYSKCLT